MKTAKNRFAFLGFDPHDDLTDPQVESSSFPEMDDEVDDRLQAYFKPRVRDVEHLFGEDMGWGYGKNR